MLDLVGFVIFCKSHTILINLPTCSSTSAGTQMCQRKILTIAETIKLLHRLKDGVRYTTAVRAFGMNDSSARYIRKGE